MKRLVFLLATLILPLMALAQDIAEFSSPNNKIKCRVGYIDNNLTASISLDCIDGVKTARFVKK